MGNTLSLGKRSYNCVDLAKFIASFLVVMIHCSFDKYDSAVIDAILCLAVPFFYACSGFFFYNGLYFEKGKIVNNKDNRQKLIKYVSRIFLLYLSWSLIYLCIRIPEWYSSGWLSLYAFVDFGIAFFLESSYYHLWYVVSLIYATIAGYLILSFINLRITTIICIVLYFVGLMLNSYSWIGLEFVSDFNNFVSGYNLIWVQFMRVFLRTIPVMVISYVFIKSKKFNRISVLLPLISVAIILFCTEAVLLNTFTSNKNAYNYIIFTIPCVILLLKLFMNVELKGNKKIYVFFRNSSTLIYCAHPMIINACCFIPGFSDLFGLKKFIPVAFVTFVYSFLFIKLSNIKRLNFLKVFR